MKRQIRIASGVIASVTASTLLVGLAPAAIRR